MNTDINDLIIFEREEAERLISNVDIKWNALAVKNARSVASEYSKLVDDYYERLHAQSPFLVNLVEWDIVSEDVETQERGYADRLSTALKNNDSITGFIAQYGLFWVVAKELYDEAVNAVNAAVVGIMPGLIRAVCTWLVLPPKM